MNKVSKANEIQQQIAQWVFGHAPKNWGKCCIYMELLPNKLDSNDTFMENPYNVVWFDTYDKKILNFELTANEESDLVKIFSALNQTVANLNERWTTCKAKVTSEGKFSFDFGYDRPPRLRWKSVDDLLYHPDYKSF